MDNIKSLYPELYSDVERTFFNTTLWPKLKDTNTFIIQPHIFYRQSVDDILAFIVPVANTVKLDNIFFNMMGDALEVGPANAINDVCKILVQSKLINQDQLGILTCIEPTLRDLDLYHVFKEQYDLSFLPEYFCISSHIGIMRPTFTDLYNRDILDMVTDNDHKQYNFLSLNRAYRIPRLAFISLILEHELQDSFCYTLDMASNEDPTKAFEYVWHHGADYLENMGLELDPAPLRDIVPVKGNYHPDKLFKVTDADLEYYVNSRISIINEAIFITSGFDHVPVTDNEFLPFTIISEKTIKAIIVGHPFMIVSTPGILAAVKELGFKTFSPYICEDYDLIEHDGDRMKAIIAEICRLDRYTVEEWEQFQQDVNSIVKHNQMHYRKLIRSTTKITELSTVDKQSKL